MIAPLRRRHRHVLTLLAVLVPVVFAAALASRKEPEFMSDEAIWRELRGETPRPTHYPLTPQLDMRGSFEGLVIPAQETPDEPILRYTETFAENDEDELEWCNVEVVLPAGNQPDTYVYWIEELAVDEMMLPAGARLIGGPLGYGAAANYSFRLEPDERLGTGHLILYSVAHMRIVMSAEVEPMRITGGGIY